MPQNKHRLEDIFKKAIKIDSTEQRNRYIGQACADDVDLLTQLEKLLQAHDQADGFLETPLLEENGTRDDHSITEGPGTVIGRYKLLEKIGEGGMAVVYMAEQELPMRRKVALKIIKLGMDTQQVIARFEAERQALALMDHPSIAKVLDAGATETGRPYFVMELVTGVSITEYCDKNKLSTEGRLALFIRVCHAVQHAHQKGIIHRDLKPTNILVTQHEGQPIPKVIDFGIAKATNQRLTEKTLFTRYAHIIGTPAYMSPEQAELSDIDIDTRSDIYSLGVLLYELLTGTTPFSEEELRKAGYAEMTRIIREREPLRPSTRLTRTETPNKSAIQNPQPKIDKDLDWIVMKTLEKPRDRRYDNVSALAEDVQRHLDDDVVLARPPRMGYRIKKFVRRHQVMVASVAVVSTLLISGIIAVGIFAYRAERSQKEATALATFLQQDIFGVLDPRRDAGRRVTVEELLDTNSQSVDNMFQDQPMVAASIHKLFGLAFHGVGKLNKAECHLKRSLEIYRDRLGERDILTLETLRELGYLYIFQRERVKAKDVLKKSLKYSRDVLGNRHPDTLRNIHMFGTALMEIGQEKEAELLLQEALDGCEQVLGPNHEDTMMCLACLGILHFGEGRPDIAEKYLIDMLYERKPSPRHLFVEGTPDRFHCLVYLAWVYNAQARYAEARALTETIVQDASTLLGRAHCETVFAMVILSIICEAEGRYDEAEALLLKTVQIRNQDTFTQPDWRWPEYQLGHFYLNRKRYVKAHDTFMAGIHKYSHFQGESHGQVRGVIRYCINLWKKQGKTEWAEQYRELLPVEERQQLE